MRASFSRRSQYIAAPAETEASLRDEERQDFHVDDGASTGVIHRGNSLENSDKVYQFMCLLFGEVALGRIFFQCCHLCVCLIIDG